MSGAWRSFEPLQTPEQAATVHAIICAWCGLVMRFGELPVSHGMCKPCEGKLNAEMDKRFGAQS